MDYTKKTVKELTALCKAAGIKYSGKPKAILIELLTDTQAKAPKETVAAAAKEPPAAPKQDTGKFRINTKDQFYTAPAVAAKCVEKILEIHPAAASHFWIEPSAGTGAFLHALPRSFKKKGLDIDPQAADIEKADFLAWSPSKAQQAKQIILFGNPPFGRQSSLAKSFITKGCTFATLIAFILPKSFMKPSMSSAFATNFHNIHTEDVAANSFLLNGEPYDVPCVFQIWERRAEQRPQEKRAEPRGFSYVKPDESPQIAFRRVGVNAGRATTEVATASPQSHYFLKLDQPALAATLIAKNNAYEYPSNTVGPRSLSKGEVNAVLNAILAELLQDAPVDE